MTATTKGALMTQAAEELKTQLAKLPEDDREALAYFLISTLPEDVDQDDAWEAELRRRDRELSSGKVQGIPAEEVFREIRERRS
jgi:putative addiction module component (TIGR02574 family)